MRSRGGGSYRPDATAWAVLALQASGVEPGDLKPARARLAADQLPDGRIAVSSEHHQGYWPTPITVLAWEQAPDFREARSRAVTFLLENTGHHFPRTSDSAVGHDTAIQGWPWIAGTHSWVIPTAAAIMALRVAGQGDHERVKAARRLLLDRQLPEGGWNYGNTVVYGQKLHPMPESTGLALSALAGIARREELAPSLAYLKTRVTMVRTPLSLSWGLLGLGAWGQRPPAGEAWLEECWQRQERYGEYDISAVSLMLLALTTPGGILSLFRAHSQPGKAAMTISRRTFLRLLVGVGGVTAASFYLGKKFLGPTWEEPVFIGSVRSYQADLAGWLLSGFRELGVRVEEIKGKRILLKPNLVETSLGAPHINTHPLVVRGAVEAFLRLGASSVVVAEGPGHIHDTLLVLEESGLAEVLQEDRIPFVDLNYDNGFSRMNAGRFSGLKTFTLPATLTQVDWIVSLAKLKTHHWAGVTLSLKNLFGVMPGYITAGPKMFSM